MIKEHTTCMVQQVFMDQKLTKLKVFWTIQEFVRKGSKKQISLLKTNFICLNLKYITLSLCRKEMRNCFNHIQIAINICDKYWQFTV